jgi:two-component system sensor histidine kinase TtrS
MPGRFILRLAALLALIVLAQTAHAAQKEATIGVLAFRGTVETLKRWSPTADYLTRSVPGYKFKIIPLTLDQIGTATQHGEIDFVLTNSGNYVDHEARYGISRIATLRAPDRVTAGNVFGAVIFVRADRGDIRNLSDLAGKSLMAVKPKGFGGFQMAWREFRDADIDPHQDLSSLQFSGFPQDAVAYAVRDGTVDAGTFRSGSLESLAAEGKIVLSDFRILNAQSHPGFPYLVSTRLYPEWPFSRLRSTDQQLSQDVAVALLRMPADSPAARRGNYGGWTVPLDYQRVHELFRVLRIGPYEHIGDITLADLFDQYGPWIIVAIVLLILAAGWASWIEFLVARRTKELFSANAALERQVLERQRAEEVARQRQAELHHVARLNTMGEMASGLAHELNHPLATINNYVQGCVRRIRQGNCDPESLLEALEGASSEAERAAAVIHSMREFIRKEGVRRENVDINAIVRDVSGLLDYEIQDNRVALQLALGDDVAPITADAVQVEQVILNLARNAIEAMGEMGNGPRNLQIGTATRDAGTVEITVCDSGPGISADLINRIFDPFVSTKSDGLGMGLSISRSIVESHGGRLWVSATGARGAAFHFTLSTTS